MTAVRALVVVVPAHDEQDRVLACLDALAVARERVAVAAPHVATSVVVTLDACRDDTAARVATRPDVDTVAVGGRCVGAARAAGTAHALARWSHLPLPQVWTAHTDADSCVPADWLVAMIAAAADGIDVVLGAVVPDAALDAPTLQAWHALHPVGDGHPYVHGANLGVRASALAAVGGWRPLPTGEDVDLAARLHADAGVVVRSTSALPVVTSARTVARAPSGFSSYLRELTVA